MKNTFSVHDKILCIEGCNVLGKQKCENCKNQFTWKEIQNAFGWGNKKLACKNCGLEHQITLQSRLLPSMIIPVLFFFYLFLSNVPYALRQTYLGFAFLLIFINGLIFPYYAKYKAFQKQ